MSWKALLFRCDECGVLLVGPGYVEVTGAGRWRMDYLSERTFPCGIVRRNGLGQDVPCTGDMKYLGLWDNDLVSTS